MLSSITRCNTSVVGQLQIRDTIIRVMVGGCLGEYSTVQHSTVQYSRVQYNNGGHKMLSAERDRWVQLVRV